LEITLSVLTVILTLSLSCNAALLFKFYIFKKYQKESYDARQLIHDLTANDKAIVEIRRIDPAHIFIRSPR
jgi:hypothetical protein